MSKKIKAAIIAAAIALTAAGCGFSSDAEAKKEIQKFIDRDNYTEAVRKAEEYGIGGSYFDDVREDIVTHYIQTAKSYYTAAATYTTVQAVSGFDCNSGFEGYEPMTRTIDPAVLAENLSEDDRAVMKRVTVYVTDTDEQGFCDGFKVYLDICGITVCYPNDVTPLE